MADKFGRKTGGRKKGTRNKKTQALLDRAYKGGIMPVEFMLKVMRDRKGYTPAERMDAAKAVAPYLRPRLSSVDQRTSLQMEDDLTKLMREISEEGRRIDDKPAPQEGNGHDKA